MHCSGTHQSSKKSRSIRREAKVWRSSACLFPLILNGCAAVNFAAPSVDLSRPLMMQGKDACIIGSNETGNSNSNLDDSRLMQKSFWLVDNYVLTYRCAINEAANGRQVFQIPSYLMALVGVASPFIGGGENTAVAAGIAASTYNSANAYYAPNAKADILDSALDAILCVQNEAVGVKFFETRDSPPKSTAAGNEVEISAERRYFNMVTGALFQIERITGSRLRSTGKFDPAGLVAEIEKLNKKLEDAKSDGTDESSTSTQVVGEGSADQGAGDDVETDAVNGAGDANGVDDDGEGTNGPAVPVQPAAAATPAPVKSVVPPPKPAKIKSPVRTDAKTGYFKIKIDELQPKLEICTVRAKI